VTARWPVRRRKKPDVAARGPSPAATRRGFFNLVARRIDGGADSGPGLKPVSSDPDRQKAVVDGSGSVRDCHVRHWHDLFGNPRDCLGSLIWVLRRELVLALTATRPAPATGAGPVAERARATSKS
jgi:hypothetical protein